MTADVKRSDFNPFRTPSLTPNATGQSLSGPSTIGASDTLAPAASSSHTNHSPQSSGPPGPQRNRFSDNETNVDQRRQDSIDVLAESLGGTGLGDGTPSEPPPAYSVTANPTEGEATVEYGPTRPFQPAPPRPQIPQNYTGISQQTHFSGSPVPQGMPYMSPQQTGMPMMANPTGPWNSGPSQYFPPQATGGYPPPVQQPFYPPQQHYNGQSPDPSHTSDFARDFYASGASISSDRRSSSSAPSNGSSEGPEEPEPFEPSRPIRRTTSSSYAPPPGPPPPNRYNSPTEPPSNLSSVFSPPPGPPPVHPSRNPSVSGTDMTPTSSPTPGRPLLNKGKILLYPSGHTCKKCLNTGYKNFDPSHPCRKCWEKYGKTYTPMMAYAPRSESSQRPLPNLRPPHLRHSHSISHPPPISPPPADGLSRTQSAYRPTPPPGPPPGMGPPSPVGPPGSFPGSPNGAPFLGGFRPPPPPVPPRPGGAPMMMPSPQLQYTHGRPPPGAAVVSPGDSRIGGRLCWRCDGRGTVSFMIFDTENCPVCNGIGRTFG